MSLTKKILIAIIAVFIIIQFFGPGQSVPDYNPSADLLSIHEPPADVESILKTACYDCHSYETIYPWYANIEPVSWWLQDHIDEARDEMNFSLWDDYSSEDVDHYLEEIVEVIEEGEMPLQSYTVIHTDARLSDEQRESLVNWASNLRSSLRPEGSSEMEEDED